MQREAPIQKKGQTQTKGHGNSMTDPAQTAESGKSVWIRGEKK